MPRDHGAGALNSDQFYAQGKRGVAQRPGRPGANAWSRRLAPLIPARFLLAGCLRGSVGVGAAKGRRGVFARMEGIPWCHVVDDVDATAAGSRHKL